SPFHNAPHLVDATISKLIANGILAKGYFLLDARCRGRQSFMKLPVPSDPKLRSTDVASSVNEMNQPIEVDPASRYVYEHMEKEIQLSSQTLGVQTVDPKLKKVAAKIMSSQSIVFLQADVSRIMSNHAEREDAKNLLLSNSLLQTATETSSGKLQFIKALTRCTGLDWNGCVAVCAKYPGNNVSFGNASWKISKELEDLLDTGYYYSQHISYDKKRWTHGPLQTPTSVLPSGPLDEFDELQNKRSKRTQRRKQEESLSNSRETSASRIHDDDIIIFSGEAAYDNEIFVDFETQLLYSHITFNGFTNAFNEKIEKLIKRKSERLSQQRQKRSNNDFTSNFQVNSQAIQLKTNSRRKQMDGKSLRINWLIYNLMRFVFMLRDSDNFEIPNSLRAKFDECPRSEGMRRVVRHLLRMLEYGDLPPAMLYDCACMLKLFIDKWYKTNHLKKSSRTNFLHTMHLAIDRFHQPNHLRQMCQKGMPVDHNSHKGIYDQVDSQVPEWMFSYFKNFKRAFRVYSYPKSFTFFLILFHLENCSITKIQADQQLIGLQVIPTDVVTNINQAFKHAFFSSPLTGEWSTKTGTTHAISTTTLSTVSDKEEKSTTPKEATEINIVNAKQTTPLDDVLDCYDKNGTNNDDNEQEQQVPDQPQVQQTNRNEVFWPLFTDTINPEAHECLTIDGFKKHYTRFLLELREGHLLPQNIIGSITSQIVILIEIIHRIIQKKTKSHQLLTASVTTANNSYILSSDLNETISRITAIISLTSKNEHQFLKLCTEYFGFQVPVQIKLNKQNKYGYYIPIQKIITEMLSKADVVESLINNLNATAKCSTADPDLMFSYRDGDQAKNNPSLQRHSNSLMFQLYTDGIGVTNPIGPKKDSHKLTVFYFLLEDLPEDVRSMLKSIILIGICYTDYLDKQSANKFFEPIVNDLNELQTTGIRIESFSGILHFAFTTLSADNLASNEIGGFQKNFNAGNFCRMCHISYEHRLYPLNTISFLPRTRLTHDNYVKKVLEANNGSVIQGVRSRSILSKLIGYHPIVSLPNDIMHDYSEGVCPIIIMAVFKEASERRLLTYGQIEERLSIFQYGDNDSSNRPPVVRKKHLAKGKISDSASQKLCLFKLLPIIFDVIEQLTTLELYTCLREIVEYVFARPFRKTWLPRLQQLTVRFHSLMVHHTPERVVPKVHFVTDYSPLILMNGPATRYWCMRYEAKRLYFKQLALRSFNFKNIPFTLAKRHQLRQCLLFSLDKYYNVIDEIYCSKIVEPNQLTRFVKNLLFANIQGFNETTTLMEYETLIYKHVRFSKGSVFVSKFEHTEEIPYFVLPSNIFKIENRYIIIVKELQTVQFEESLWCYEIERLQIHKMMVPDDLIKIHPNGLDIYDVNNLSYVNILSQQDVDGETLRLLQQTEIEKIFPKLKQRVKFVSERDLLFSETKQSHINLLVPVLNESNETALSKPLKKDEMKQTSGLIVIEHNLHDDILSYDVYDETIETAQHIQHTTNTDQENIESENIAPKPRLLPDYTLPLFTSKVQQAIAYKQYENFAGHTNHRRLLLDSVYEGAVSKYCLYYSSGNDYTIMTQAILRTLNTPLTDMFAMLYISEMNDCNNDEDGMEKVIQTIKDELKEKDWDSELVIRLWRKSFQHRRLYVRDHPIAEVLEKYPGFGIPDLIFEEVKMTDGIDLAANALRFLPNFLKKVPNEGFVNDLWTVRLVKLLSKYYKETWQHILSEKEPISPKPFIRLTEESFNLYLDWRLICTTGSHEEALALIFAIYNIFEIQITGVHNRVIHLITLSSGFEDEEAEIQQTITGVETPSQLQSSQNALTSEEETNSDSDHKDLNEALTILFFYKISVGINGATVDQNATQASLVTDTYLQRDAYFTAEDYLIYFDPAATDKPGQHINQQHGSVTLFQVPFVPGLLGIELGAIRLQLKKCAIRQPLTFRSDVITYVLEGHVRLGFVVQTRGKLIENILSPGMGMIIPKGALSYIENLNCTSASILSTLSSNDFGVSLLPSLFLYTLPEHITRAAFGDITSAEYQKMKKIIIDNQVFSVNSQCLKACKK
ncbi:unnamed protein product, partial [Didymodactylos carnosus]